MRNKPHPEHIAMPVERGRDSESQRLHSSSPFRIFSSTVSNLVQALFPMQHNVHNDRDENTSGIGRSMEDITSINRPQEVPHGAAGNILGSNPVRKQISPNVESIRYIPSKAPPDQSAQNGLETNDGERSQTGASSPGEETTPSPGQKIRNQELVQKMDERIYHLEVLVYNLRNSNMQFERQAETQHNAILVRNNEINIRGKEIHRLNEQLARKSQELDTFRDEREKQEEQVRLAQQGSFRHLEQAKWAPREDSTIRSELARFFGELRSWAKRFSSSDLSNLEKMSVESQGNLIAALYESVEGNDFTSSSGWINAEKTKDKSPFILTQAMLAAYISRKIFEVPFFFLDDVDANLAGSMLNSGQAGFGSNLNALYQDMKKVDVSQAHAWRSDTLRVLSTPSHHNSGNTPEPGLSLKTRIAKMRERMCETLSSDFINGPVQLLSRQGKSQEEIEKLKSELFHLLSSAGEISTRLWTQRTNVEIKKGLDGLRTFSVDDELMTAHRLHKLDDDDHRLDGKRVVAVIQPAIGASGDHEGQNYDQYKVWSKAVVLVDDCDED